MLCATGSMGGMLSHVCTRCRGPVRSSRPARPEQPCTWQYVLSWPQKIQSTTLGKAINRNSNIVHGNGRGSQHSCFIHKLQRCKCVARSRKRGEAYCMLRRSASHRSLVQDLPDSAMRARIPMYLWLSKSCRAQTDEGYARVEHSRGDRAEGWALSHRERHCARTSGCVA
eukprot:360923-Chlamydomonas_euryale.AAC.4